MRFGAGDKNTHLFYRIRRQKTRCSSRGTRLPVFPGSPPCRGREGGLLSGRGARPDGRRWETEGVGTYLAAATAKPPPMRGTGTEKCSGHQVPVAPTGGWGWTFSRHPSAAGRPKVPAQRGNQIPHAVRMAQTVSHRTPSRRAIWNRRRRTSAGGIRAGPRIGAQIGNRLAAPLAVSAL
ncbi:hypothetical protein HMPREF0262_02633 [Clostridium sp. ATCC 29733]|nr:hypothetical protein HMPREF0262_02633 [Clostridium sp. ATCC 29733]